MLLVTARHPQSGQVTKRVRTDASVQVSGRTVLVTEYGVEKVVAFYPDREDITIQEDPDDKL